MGVTQPGGGHSASGGGGYSAKGEVFSQGWGCGGHSARRGVISRGVPSWDNGMSTHYMAVRHASCVHAGGLPCFHAVFRKKIKRLASPP